MGWKTGRFYKIKNNKEDKTSDWLGSVNLVWGETIQGN